MPDTWRTGSGFAASLSLSGVGAGTAMSTRRVRAGPLAAMTIPLPAHPANPGTTRVTVNGRPHDLRVPRHTPLLAMLRNDLGLNGPKYGCGLGECGACMVLVEGVAARSCVIPVGGVEGRSVTTLEGLAADDGRRHPVQQAFIDCQAAQCGYCLNGMIVATVALLGRNPRPTEREARAALSHNLCRCGTHLEILQAVQRAADLMAATQTPVTVAVTTAGATTGGDPGRPRVAGA